MKTIKIIATVFTPFLILLVAFALMGCEDGPGTSVGDAGSVGTLEEGASLPGGVDIIGEETEITHVGQTIEFEAKGGHWPYTWTVAHASGTITVMQNGPPHEVFTAVYEALSVGANTISVEDSAGRTGTKEITAPAANALATLPTEVNFGTNVAGVASFDIHATGGIGPYTWSTDNPTRIDLSDTTGSKITVTVKGPYPIDSEFKYNVYVFDQGEDSATCPVTGEDF